MSWDGALEEIVLPTLAYAMCAWLLISVEGLRCEISKMKATLGRIEEKVAQIEPLRVKLCTIEAMLKDINANLSSEKDREERRELLQELHRQLELRFDESDEGVAYGGTALAVDRLLLRAKPDVDAAFADILASPRSGSPMLLTQDISNDLWERRMQFLERTGPTTP